MNGNYESYPQPEIKLPSNALAGDQGEYWVELGDQRFSKHQWELIQLYAEGNHRAKLADAEAAQRKAPEGWHDGFGSEIYTRVFESLGAASVCWDEDGVFQDQRAIEIGNTLVDWIIKTRPQSGEGHKAQRQNREFHNVMGIATAASPRAIPVEDVPVVIELIREEFIDELIGALGARVEFNPNGTMKTITVTGTPNVVEIYDAAIDILYVVYGLLNRAGMQAEPGYDEVQASNMSKLGEDGKAIIAGPNDPDGIFEGRVKKGPNYFKPNLTMVLMEQGWVKPTDAEQIDFGGFEDH